MPRTIRTEIQKRFSDIDSFRHVNNVSQQMYFDVGKSDFFDRLLGPEILFAPVRIITAATDTSYMGQIRPEDRIAVPTCWMKPSFMMTIRSPSVMASVWSWVT